MDHVLFLLFFEHSYGSCLMNQPCNIIYRTLLMKFRFPLIKVSYSQKWFRCCLVLWLRVRFTRSNTFWCLVNEANLILLGRAYWFLLPSRKNGETAKFAASPGNFLEQWSMAPLLQCSIFLKKKINEKNLVFFFSEQHQCS